MWKMKIDRKRKERRYISSLFIVLSRFLASHLLMAFTPEIPIPSLPAATTANDNDNKNNNDFFNILTIILLRWLFWMRCWFRCRFPFSFSFPSYAYCAHQDISIRFHSSNGYSSVHCSLSVANCGACRSIWSCWNPWRGCPVMFCAFAAVHRCQRQ